jgi:hypothetical protein
LLGGTIVSKLELDALRERLFLNLRISPHIERRFPVDRPNPCDVLRKPLFLSISLHIERRFSRLIAGLIMSKLERASTRGSRAIIASVMSSGNAAGGSDSDTGPKERWVAGWDDV